MSDQQLQDLAHNLVTYRDTQDVRADHGFQPIVFGSGNECWYYEHASAGELTWRRFT